MSRLAATHGLLCLGLALGPVLAAAFHIAQPAVAQGAKVQKMALPLANAAEGRRLFVNKGCVVCHSVNGVGGKAAPAQDTAGAAYVDVFDFVARMWRGAPTMIVLQEMELGYQIDLSGDELAHLAAFAADPAEQARFSDSEIPEVIRDWMVDEVYQELDPDYMTR
jgi:cytochrome c